MSERLRTGAQALGVELDCEQLSRLGRYLALLREWNARINLTAVVEPAAIVDRHFLDSLAAVPLVSECRTLVDVGSGAGFPGAVLAIALPALQVTCVDSVSKKVAFLGALARDLPLAFEPLWMRDEALAHGGRRFDAVVSRAAFPPEAWLARGSRLVAPGGRLLVWQADDAPVLEPPPGFSTLSRTRYQIAGIRRMLQACRREVAVPRGTTGEPRP